MVLTEPTGVGDVKRHNMSTMCMDKEIVQQIEELARQKKWKPMKQGNALVLLLGLEYWWYHTTINEKVAVKTRRRRENFNEGGL